MVRFEMKFSQDHAEDSYDLVPLYPGSANLCNGCENQNSKLNPLPCNLVDFQSYGLDGYDFIGPDLRRRKNGIEICDQLVIRSSIVDLDVSSIISSRSTR